jgi:DNA-binding response OmpR family regulator
MQTVNSLASPFVTALSRRATWYAPLQVLIYSSSASVRMRVREALGQLPDKHGAPLAFVETATQDATLREINTGGIDLVVLDAEAAPAGGLGLARQLKDELLQCPPVIVLIARPDDSWLARWSGADAVVSRAVDPIGVRQTFMPLLRSRLVI